MAGPLFSNVNSAVAPAQEAYYKRTGVIPHYQISLDVVGPEALNSKGKKIFPIIANLPERFNMEMTSQWDSPFARTSGGDLVSGATGGRVSADAANMALGAMGIGKTIKAQSYQVWTESSPMNFNVEMVFRATTDSATDVREKHLALLKLAAPSTMGSGGISQQILRAPGPILSNKEVDSANSRIITLYIGRYLVLKNVVIKSVSSDILCLFDEKGIPQAMTVNLAVESWNACYTTDDLEDLFSISG